MPLTDRLEPALFDPGHVTIAIRAAANPGNLPRAPLDFVFDPGHGKTDHGLIVDEAFSAIAAPLARAEEQKLKRELTLFGYAHSPLIYWKQTRILLDGHNRFKWCLDLGIPFGALGMEFPDREAAWSWAVHQHTARRNTTRLAASCYRGMLYNQAKRLRGGTGANRYTARVQMVQNEPSVTAAAGGLQMVQNEPSVPRSRNERLADNSTAARVAQQNYTTRSTIKRDARLVDARDRIIARCGDVGRQFIMHPDNHLTAQDVHAMDRSPEEGQREVVRVWLQTGQVLTPWRPETNRDVFLVHRNPPRLDKDLLAKLTIQELAGLFQRLSAIITKHETEAHEVSSSVPSVASV
jgi:hypothetical protein